MEEPEVVAVAGPLPDSEGGDSLGAPGEAQARHPVDQQLGLHRRDPDPVALLDLGAVRAQRVGVLGHLGHPPGALEAVEQVLGPGLRPAAGGAVALRAREVGEVQQAADGVDGHVELLGTHALPLHVPGPLEPAVTVGVQLGHRPAHPVDGEAVQLVAEAVVAGPAPDQGERAGELDRLVGVALVLVRAEVDAAVGDHLVDHLAGVAVGHPAHVAQGAQVILDRAELAGGHAGEGGVLAVGGEQPRVVGKAGAQEADARHRARGRRVGLARVTSRTCRSSATCTESARFCLLHSMPCWSSRSPGRERRV